MLQPHPLTSVMQLSITAMALCIAAAALAFTLKVSSDERNARLVELGLRVLMVDPGKEEGVKPARSWALDLIDANAGVKFSAEARKALLAGPLSTVFTYWDTSYGTADFKPRMDRHPPPEKVEEPTVPDRSGK